MREMDNHDPVMIFAGYPNEMASSFTSNAGLYRRIPFVLNFPNYSMKNLCTLIFRYMITRYHYRVEEESAIEEAFDYIDESQIRAMSAGLCQLILQKAKDHLIGRLQVGQLMSADLDTLSREDLISAARSLPDVPGE